MTGAPTGASLKQCTAKAPASGRVDVIWDLASPADTICACLASPDQQVAISRFVEFTRAEWAELRASTPLPLSEPQLRALVSINEPMSLDEVADIYLPLSRLLNLYVAATRNLHAATATFLGTDTPRVPFVIGIAGQRRGGEEHGVSRCCRRCCHAGRTHPKVDLVTTDGFLLAAARAGRARIDRSEGLSGKLRRAPTSSGSWPM